MGIREWNSAKPWMLKWPKEHIGRVWKRKLSKYHRREAKLQIRGIGQCRGNGIEGECNRKTW